MHFIGLLTIVILIHTNIAMYAEYESLPTIDMTTDEYYYGPTSTLTETKRKLNNSGGASLAKFERLRNGNNDNFLRLGRRISNAYDRSKRNIWQRVERQPNLYDMTLGEPKTKLGPTDFIRLGKRPSRFNDDFLRLGRRNSLDNLADYQIYI